MYVCAQVGSLLFLVMARKRERVHVKEAAGALCARFVCHISACLRLMQMGRGAGRDGSMGNCWC